MAKDMHSDPSPQPDDPKRTKPTPEEQELIDRFGQWVARRGLTVPAILFIESGKPLNWIVSQGMLIGEPAAWALDPMMKAAFNFSHGDYLKLQALLEKRWSVEYLLQSIEKHDEIQQDKEREARKKLKAEKKELRAKRKAKRQKFFRKLFGNERPEDLK